MKQKLLSMVNRQAPNVSHFLAGVLVAVVFFSWILKPETVNTTVDTLPQTAAVSEAVAAPLMSAAEPVRLRIPELDINTTFVSPLGLLESGEVQVPDSNTEVGWYKYSPTPGELGPAVILGHVDSHTGPAVFFYLGQLEPGDDVYVDRADGTVAHFRVDALERPRQSDFPTERVYGNIAHAGLRLITCSGIYLRGQAQYSHNLIVYASLVVEE